MFAYAWHGSSPWRTLAATAALSAVACSCCRLLAGLDESSDIAAATLADIGITAMTHLHAGSDVAVAVLRQNGGSAAPDGQRTSWQGEVGLWV
jgi:hypothetical protein